MHYIITAVDAFDRQQMTVILLTVICYHILLTRGGEGSQGYIAKGGRTTGGKEAWALGAWSVRVQIGVWLVPGCAMRIARKSAPALDGRGDALCATLERANPQE